MPVVPKELVRCRLACRHLAHKVFRDLLCAPAVSASHHLVIRKLRTPFGFDLQARFDIEGHRRHGCVHRLLVEGQLRSRS